MTWMQPIKTPKQTQKQANKKVYIFWSYCNLKTNAYSQQSLGSNQFWNWFDTDDIIVKQMNSNNEQILFESFQFSDNNNNELTYDYLLEALSRE